MTGKAPRRRQLVLGLLLCAVSFSGCGGSGSNAQAPEPRPGFDPAAPWGDEARSRPGTTTLAYWRLIQIGSYPLAAQIYAPSVVSAVGESTFLNALAAQRPGVAAQRPKILEERSLTPSTRLVEVESRNAAGEGGRYSFVLERGAEGWQIVYDSLVGDSMESALAQQYAARAGKDGSGLEKAKQGAAVASDAYRAAGFEAISDRRIDGGGASGTPLAEATKEDGNNSPGGP